MKWYQIVLGVVILCSLSASIIAPYSPTTTQPDMIYAPPQSNHWLGTDHLGRDVLSRTLYGGRRTLSVSLFATVIAACLGFMMGLGASSNTVLIRELFLGIIDAVLAFPAILIALIMLAVLGQGSLQIAIAIGFAQAPFFGRLVYTNVMSIEQNLFVMASVSQGASQHHVWRYHILPHALPVLLSYAGIIFAYSIINSAALSLLGLGANPSIPEWGQMLADGRSGFRVAPWAAFAPGIIISITVLCINRWIDYISS